MAATGVSVADEVIAEFSDFKLKRVPFKFIIYHVTKAGKIETLARGEPGSSFDAFVENLPPNDCRYAVIDWDFTTNDNRQASKIVFVSWCPDTSAVRQKMTYAGSAAALTEALTGVATKINATDRSELTESILTEACRKFA